MEYTIGQLAKLAKLNTVTIRYYEKTNLINKANRLKNGYRSYSDTTLKQLRFIKNAQLIGFSLAEIKELQTINESETKSAQNVKTFVQKKIELIDAKINALLEIKNELRQLDVLCNGNVVREECPILKALAQ